MNGNHPGKHGLGPILQIVKRLYDDPLFRDSALTNPELAFALYPLEPAEKKALKSLIGRMASDELLSANSGPLIWWWPSN